MPIKPPPLRIECRQCGWTTLHAPGSDALIGTPPAICEKCGSRDLARTPASTMESVFSSVFSLLKK